MFLAPAMGNIRLEIRDTELHMYNANGVVMVKLDLASVIRSMIGTRKPLEVNKFRRLVY